MKKFRATRSFFGDAGNFHRNEIVTLDPSNKAVKELLSKDLLTEDIEVPSRNPKLDAIAGIVGAAQTDADTKIAAIADTVKAAQTDADTKIAAIADTVKAAQTDADTKIAAIADTVKAAQTDADTKIAAAKSKSSAAASKQGD